MKKSMVYWGISIAFFVIYFKLLQLIWDWFIPFNTLTDLTVIFILVFVNIPLSVISAEKLFAIIKKDKY